MKTRDLSALSLLARRRAAAALVLAALIAVGCGSSDSGTDDGKSAKPAAHRPASGGARTTVYFLSDKRTVPLGVRRALTRRTGVPTARLALEELIAGPTAAERERGLKTAIPSDVAIRSFSIATKDRGSDAFVDLAGLPNANDADVVAKVRVMTQVARTLIGLNDIARVWLRVDGRAWGLWGLQGNIRDDAIDYKRLRGFFHICTARPGTEAVAGDCFTALP